jgi:hypothetical protein
MLSAFSHLLLFRFQTKDDIKAARIEATKAYRLYVAEPKTSQQGCRFDLELELPIFLPHHVGSIRPGPWRRFVTFQKINAFH